MEGWLSPEQFSQTQVNVQQSIIAWHTIYWLHYATVNTRKASKRCAILGVVWILVRIIILSAFSCSLQIDWSSKNLVAFGQIRIYNDLMNHFHLGHSLGTSAAFITNNLLTWFPDGSYIIMTWATCFKIWRTHFLDFNQGANKVPIKAKQCISWGSIIAVHSPKLITIVLVKARWLNIWGKLSRIKGCGLFF